MLLAVIAPLTITSTVIENIGTLLEKSTGQAWAANAKVTFGHYAENYASTSAVLLGLHFRRT
jgi:hypothetical protein